MVTVVGRIDDELGALPIGLDSLGNPIPEPTWLARANAWLNRCIDIPQCAESFDYYELLDGRVTVAVPDASGRAFATAFVLNTADGKVEFEIPGNEFIVDPSRRYVVSLISKSPSDTTDFLVIFDGRSSRAWLLSTQNQSVFRLHLDRFIGPDYIRLIGGISGERLVDLATRHFIPSDDFTPIPQTEAVSRPLQQGFSRYRFILNAWRLTDEPGLDAIHIHNRIGDIAFHLLSGDSTIVVLEQALGLARFILWYYRWSGTSWEPVPHYGEILGGDDGNGLPAPCDIAGFEFRPSVALGGTGSINCGDLITFFTLTDSGKIARQQTIGPPYIDKQHDGGIIFAPCGGAPPIRYDLLADTLTLFLPSGPRSLVTGPSFIPVVSPDNRRLATWQPLKTTTASTVLHIRLFDLDQFRSVASADIPFPDWEYDPVDFAFMPDGTLLLTNRKTVGALDWETGKFLVRSLSGLAGGETRLFGLACAGYRRPNGSLRLLWSSGAIVDLGAAH